jgi:hypothetical protein
MKQRRREELPNLDRLLDWTTVFVEKQRYLQCPGGLFWLTMWRVEGARTMRQPFRSLSLSSGK